MKTIPLTQGQVALVDDEDCDYLMQWKWHAQKKKKSYYVARFVRIDHKKTIIYLHRVIMNTPKEMEVDHIDHNGLNCQKHNLRNCTTSQNAMNRIKRSSTVSKYHGVHISRRGHSPNIYITANIMINGKLTHIGNFKTEKEAAIARDIAAKKYYGEFAKLNFKE